MVQHDAPRDLFRVLVSVGALVAFGQAAACFDWDAVDPRVSGATGGSHAGGSHVGGSATGGAGLTGGDGGTGLSGGGSGGTAGTGPGGGGTGGTGGSPTGTGGSVSQTIDVRIIDGGGDVEECLVVGPQCPAVGSIYEDSTDLELVDDPNYVGLQIVGLRFPQLGISQGATITAAYIEFVGDEAHSLVTDLTIEAEAADDAPAFSLTIGDVSARPRTTASASWTPAAWVVAGIYPTPSLVSVVQEVVNRSGFGAGSSMVFIISGTGRRTAEAFDGDAPHLAALLHVEFTP